MGFRLDLETCSQRIELRFQSLNFELERFDLPANREQRSDALGQGSSDLRTCLGLAFRSRTCAAEPRADGKRRNAEFPGCRGLTAPPVFLIVFENIIHNSGFLLDRISCATSGWFCSRHDINESVAQRQMNVTKTATNPLRDCVIDKISQILPFLEINSFRGGRIGTH